MEGIIESCEQTPNGWIFRIVPATRCKPAYTVLNFCIKFMLEACGRPLVLARKYFSAKKNSCKGSESFRPSLKVCEELSEFSEKDKYLVVESCSLK